MIEENLFSKMKWIVLFLLLVGCHPPGDGSDSADIYYVERDSSIQMNHYKPDPNSSGILLENVGFNFDLNTGVVLIEDKINSCETIFRVDTELKERVQGVVSRLRICRDTDEIVCMAMVIPPDSYTNLNLNFYNGFNYVYESNSCLQEDYFVCEQTVAEDLKSVLNEVVNETPSDTCTDNIVTLPRPWATYYEPMP